jgi:cyanoexosortase A
MKFLGSQFLNERKGLSFFASFLCLGILALIHISIDFHLGKQSHMMMSLLVWSSVALLLWDHRHQSVQQPSKASLLIGIASLSALLIVSLARPGEKIIGFFPLLAFSSWFLIFLGLRQLKVHAKAFAILVAFGIPKLVPETAFGLASMTAKFSAFALHYFVSYPVKLIDGIKIQIPNGSVEVVPACSGISLIVHMLSISVIFLCLFPAKKRDFFFLPVLAASLGFILNGIRVAVLAALSAPESVEGFQYWHSASGASMFVLAALLLYGSIWIVLFRPLN